MAQDEESFLTIAELADRLGVSDSTIRNWRRANRDLITEVMGKDDVRRYALSTFEEIAVLRSRRLPATEVRAALALRHGEPPPAEPPVETFEAAVLSRLDRLIGLVERIADRLDPPAERS